MRLKHYWLLLTFSLCTTAMLAQSGLQTNYYDKFDWFEMKGVGKPLKKGFLHHFRKIKVISDSLGNTVEVKYLRSKIATGRFGKKRLWIKRMKQGNEYLPLYVMNRHSSSTWNIYRQIIVPISKDSFYLFEEGIPFNYLVYTRMSDSVVKYDFLKYSNSSLSVNDRLIIEGGDESIALSDEEWLKQKSNYYTKEMIETFKKKVPASVPATEENVREAVIFEKIDKKHYKWAVVFPTPEKSEIERIYPLMKNSVVYHLLFK